MAGTMTTRETTPRRWFEMPPMNALRREMDDLFENFLGMPMTGLAAKETLPRLDVAETENAVEVKTDIPGMKPEEVEIEVHENVLTIKGHHEEEKKEGEAGKKFHRVERKSGSFARSVWLPCAVEEAKVTAELKEGVLTINLPKLTTAKPCKVAIKS